MKLVPFEKTRRFLETESETAQFRKHLNSPLGNNLTRLSVNTGHYKMSDSLCRPPHDWSPALATEVRLNPVCSDVGRFARAARSPLGIPDWFLIHGQP
jgi:hypothetical protein